MYVVFEVPDDCGVAEFLQGGFMAAMKSVKLATWSFPDGLDAPELPLVVEGNPSWDRRGRLPFETGVGAVRAYSAASSSFDDVVAAIRKFLPAPTPACANQ